MYTIPSHLVQPFQEPAHMVCMYAYKYACMQFPVIWCSLFKSLHTWYVCMHISMHVYNSQSFGAAFSRACTHGMYVCICIYMYHYTCVCVCVCVCVYVYVYIQGIYVCICIYMYHYTCVCVCVCVFVCMYMCLYIYIYLQTKELYNTHTYIYIYTHIYTCMHIYTCKACTINHFPSFMYIYSYIHTYTIYIYIYIYVYIYIYIPAKHAL